MMILTSIKKAVEIILVTSLTTKSP